jgi:hypothetical protein
MLVEVPSVAFRAEILKDGSTSDIVIEKNTTAMSNEMLAHRIGLIPIHANPANWNPNKYEFKLNVENTSNSLLDVKVADIEVYERNNDDELIKIPNIKFFHPDPISHDTCLLAVLKPSVRQVNVLILILVIVIPKRLKQSLLNGLIAIRRLIIMN